MIDPATPWAADLVDTEPLAAGRLADLKSLIEKKPVGFWTSADDLYGKSSVALVKAFTSNPRTGWIRGSSALGPEVTAEISRLSAENASLRAQLSRVIGESERDNERALDDLLITLRGNKQEYFVRVAGKTGWQEIRKP